MSRDEITAAYDEWYKDAMRDVSKLPNRWEAFYAGWQACLEWMENGGQSENTTED
jgi:hypothetical protein